MKTHATAGMDDRAGAIRDDGDDGAFLGRTRLSVMVVDDDFAVARTVAAVVRCRLDAEVTAFSLPIAALDAFAENPGRWDVVISDFNMPAMTGAEPAGWLRHCRPDIPLVIMSGAVDAETACVGIAGPVEFVHKPFLGLPLIEAIEAVTVCPCA